MPKNKEFSPHITDYSRKIKKMNSFYQKTAIFALLLPHLRANKNYT